MGFFFLATLIPQVSVAQDPQSLVFADTRGLVVTQEDVNYYFSSWGSGQSPELMAKTPNIEMAVENLYVARRLAAQAKTDGLLSEADQTWMQRFLADRKAMQLALNRLVTEQLSETDWSGLAQDYYLGNPEEFKEPEQIRASHILFQLNGQRLIDTMKRADLARDRILAGEAFADVAVEETDDVGGRPGGDLGFFGKGRMVPAFEQAAFALEEGEISDLVVTSFGVHVIQQNGRKEERSIPFEEVEAAIIKKLKPKVWTETREQVLADYRAEMLSDDNFTNLELIEQLRSAAQAE